MAVANSTELEAFILDVRMPPPFVRVAKTVGSEEPVSEYVPELGVYPATIQMYDQEFTGAAGAIFKQRVEAAARQVGLNPGLLAASLLAEFGANSYTRTTGEVKGWDIGVDDYKERHAEIEARIPVAKSLKPTRYTSETNENKRHIPQVPVFKAQDAVLASAVYLKFAELQVRGAFAGIGGSFDRLSVEDQFALTRYTMNAGPGAMRQRALEFLGMTQKKDGTFNHKNAGKAFLQHKHGALTPSKTGDGPERFNRHHPPRAATAHAAQAIHLSQRVFGVIPDGGRDSLMLP
jgi:hypothetical protein